METPDPASERVIQTPPIDIGEDPLKPEVRSKSRPSWGCLYLSGILTLLLTAILTAVAVLLGLVFIRREKYSRLGAEHGHSERELALLPAGEVCQTPVCIKQANETAKKMDRLTNPCDDFDEYACGNLYRAKDFTVEKPFTTVSMFQHKPMLEGILTSSRGDHRHSMRNAKTLYRSCVDTDTIDRIGVQPYLETPFAKEWPTLNTSQWSEQNFSMESLVVRYSLEGIFPLFQFAVLPNLEDTSEYTLYLDEPHLSQKRIYYLRGTNDSNILQYKNDLQSVALELGADPSVAAQDVTDLVNLEIEIAKITKDPAISLPPYTTTTLGELGDDYKLFAIPQAWRALFATANVTLEDTQEIIVVSPSYFSNLRKIYEKLDPSRRDRNLQNVFSFHYAHFAISELTPKLRNAYGNLNMTDNVKRWLRQYVCLLFVSGTFPLTMATGFLSRDDLERHKANISTMIDNIQSAFAEGIQAAPWMSASTKQKAVKKLKAIKRKIGYPEKAFDLDYVEKIYEDLTMSSDNYYENKNIIRRLQQVQHFSKLGKPVDKTEWSLGYFSANAIYHALYNDINIPAGILMPPFFSDDFLPATNYARMGFIIGHEFTHGFDPTGRRFDHNGNLAAWWTGAEDKEFETRLQCIVDQYGQFRDEQLGMQVNGTLTKSENMADMVGLKISYRGYRKFVESQGPQPTLPQIYLNGDQLFFLGFAQTLCAQEREFQRIRKMDTDKHALSRYRMLGALQNFPEFAKAFRCPKGSPMNPEQKCTFW